MSFPLLVLSAAIANSIFSSSLVISEAHAVPLEELSTSTTNFDNQKSQQRISIQSRKSSREDDTTTIIQIQGNLDDRDERVSSDNSVYEVHNFDGQAGQRVVIQMNSNAFDTYLMLLDPNGQMIEQNDDYQESTNSSIDATLLQEGTYSVIANAFDSSGRGSYTLTVTDLRNGIARNQQSSAQIAGEGIAEGFVTLPSEVTPAMRVCAQSVSNLHSMSCISTSDDWNGAPVPFSMNLSPGDYYFFSYLPSEGGELFMYHSVESNRYQGNGQPEVVSVRDGETVSNLHPNHYRTCSNYPRYCITPPGGFADSAF